MGWVKKYWRFIPILLGLLIVFGGIIFSINRLYTAIGAILLAISLINLKEIEDLFYYKFAQFYAENLVIALIGGGMITYIVPELRGRGVSIILSGTIILLFGVLLRVYIYKFEVESEANYLKYLKKNKPK